MVARPTVTELHVLEILERGPAIITEIEKALLRAGTPVSCGYIRRLCSVLTADRRVRELSVKTMRVRRGVSLFVHAKETPERIDEAVTRLRSETAQPFIYGRAR